MHLENLSLLKEDNINVKYLTKYDQLTLRATYFLLNIDVQNIKKINVILYMHSNVSIILFYLFISIRAYMETIDYHEILIISEK